MIYNAYQNSHIGINGISIVSSGHIFAEKGRRISRPNGRCDYLLFYVSKGQELFSLDKDAIADDGSFILFRPYEKQEHVYIGEQTGEFYYIHFKAPDDFDLSGFESSKIYKTQKSTKICDIFEEIIHELQTKRSSYEKLCVAKLFTVLSLLERLVKNEDYSQNHYESQIFHIIQLMNTQYEKNYTLEDYASACNMSKYHFLRIFKKITGTPPIEYRNEIRIQHAKDFLEDTTYSICEIGQKVGYSSDSYFCDTFKRYTGISPSQYRREIHHMHKFPYDNTGDTYGKPSHNPKA